MDSVAVVVPGYGRDVVGGSERLAAHWARLLSRSYHVDVITTFDGADDGVPADGYGPNIRVHRFRAGRRWYNVPDGVDPYRHFGLPAMARFIAGDARNNPALAALQRTPPAATRELIRSRGPYSPEMLGFLRENQGKWKRVLLTPYLHATTLFAARELPPATVRILLAAHAEPDICFPAMRDYAAYPWLVYFPEEAQMFAAAALIGRYAYATVRPCVPMPAGVAPRNSRDRPARILIAGRAGKGKGTDVLLRMLSEIRNSHEFIVQLVGSVDEDIVDDVEARKEWAQVLGRVDEEALQDAYRSATMLVNPSMLDSFGLVNVEAALQGTPVILNTSCPAFGWLRSRHPDAMFHGYHDRQTLASAVASLLDPGNNERISRLTAAWARSYCDQGYLEQMMEDIVEDRWPFTSVEADSIVSERAAEPATSRNSPCWCGSGKRFKACHGAPPAGGGSAPDAGPSDAAELMSDALIAQQADDLERAETLYRAALAIEPRNPDALHMLGVIRTTLFDFDEAKALIERAGALTEWKHWQYRHNYGYLLSAYMTGRGATLDSENGQVRAALSALRSDALSRAAGRRRPPRIAVFRVPPEASGVVHRQRTDGPTCELLILPWRATAGEPVPATCRRLLLAAESDVDYIAFWSGDGDLDGDRIAGIVADLDAKGAGWGFSAIEFASSASPAVRRPWPAALLKLQPALANAPFSKNVSAMCFVAPTLPAMVDNLVVRADLLMAVECAGPSPSAALPELVLELSKRDDPVFASGVALRPSLAQARAWSAAQPGMQAALEVGLRRYVAESLAGRTFPNPLAPCERRDGLRFLKRALRNGAGAHLDIATLQDIAARLAAREKPSPEPLRIDGFDLIGFARTESGLGENLRAIARTCEAAGIPVAVSDVDIEVGMRKSDHSVDHLITAAPRFAQQIILVNPDALAEGIHHEGADAVRLAYRIGYWAWELEKPPAAWIRAAKLLDELWLPSEFVRKAFAGSIDIPAYTLPTPIRAPLPSRHYARAEFNLRDDETVFLFSFAYGSLAARKNPWAVVRAFREAFPPGVGDVRLVVKAVQGELFAEAAASLHALAGDDPRILFLEGFMARDRLMGLQNACDCYVSLHRSEGFGLGMAECMALGKTVIATAYSANLDFMSEHNSLLVDYTLVPVKAGEYPDTQGQVWADASIESAARNMRRAHADAPLRATLGRAAASFMRERYSEQAIGRLLRAHLERIAGKETPRSAGSASSGPPRRHPA